MSDSKTDPLSTLKKVAGASVPALLAAVLVPPDQPAAAVAFAAMMTVVTTATWHRRNEGLSEGYARGLRQTKTSQDIREQIRERIASDPAYVERIYQVLTKLRDAFSDDVAAAMGVLAAEYTKTLPVKPPDAFFRGMLGLLGSVDSEEFRTLVDAVEAMLRIPIVSPGRYSFMVLMTVSPRTGWSTNEANHPDRLLKLESPHAKRICELLRANGLADDGDQRDFGSGEAIRFRSAALMEPEVLKRIHAIVSKPAPDPSSSTAHVDAPEASADAR